MDSFAYLTGNQQRENIESISTFTIDAGIKVTLIMASLINPKIAVEDKSLFSHV